MSDPLSHDERELQRRLSPRGASSPRRSEEAFAAAVFLAVQERQGRRWFHHASLRLWVGAAACAALLWVASGAPRPSNEDETAARMAQAVVEPTPPQASELLDVDEEDEWFAAWEDESLDVESLDDDELLALATALERALAL